VANIKSQIKRNRQNEKRRVRNKAVRSEPRTRTKNALAAAEQGGDERKILRGELARQGCRVANADIVEPSRLDRGHQHRS